MKQRMSLLAVAAVLVALLPTIAAAESITAYFEGDPGDPLTVDTYPGVAGDGWVAGWAKRTTSLTSNTVALGTTSPLATGTGNYLSAVMDASADNGYLTVGRRYARTTTGVAEPDKIDATQDYTVSALFRLDEDLSLTWGDSSNDRYEIYQGTSTSQLAAGFGSAGTWCIGAYGADVLASDGVTVLVPAGTWYFKDYVEGAIVPFNTGISLTQGTTYAVDVTVHPDYTWDATMSDGVTTVSKNSMGTRVQSYSGGYVEFFGKASTAADNRAFSVDAVEVHQVPEPSMLIMALGAALAGLAIGRRK